MMKVNYVPWGQEPADWSPGQLREGLRQCDPEFFPLTRTKIEREIRKRGL